MRSASEVIVWLLLTASCSIAVGKAPQVHINSGAISGTSADGVDRFEGIPYAAPPIGALRWRAPQPVLSWRGVRASDRYGHVCYQKPSSAPGHVIAAQDMSEDCLTLNVFRPAAGAARNLPVMVWIHGGAMVAGSASLPVYDGGVFARGGVILVSLNYRLGRLGIFAHPALSAQNADGGRLGSYALMDQIAALQWVARNIASFGGDPHNVTIFGESSGGLCVNTLMVTPQARGLFQHAISESGYGRAYFRRVSSDAPDGRESAEKVGIDFATRLGLQNPTAADLRAVTAERIIAAATFGYDEEFSFVLDGKVLTEDMWASFRAGREAPVPYILGTNSLEEPSPVWQQRVADRHVLEPTDLPGLATAYGGQEALADNLLSDIEFTEQARALARLHEHNGYSTYVYLFSVLPADARGEAKGARHGSELRYVFGNIGVGAPTGAVDRTDAGAPRGADTPIVPLTDAAVANIMNGLWRTFAIRGDPNGPALPVWPRYDGERIIEFTGAGAAAHPDERNGRLDALAAIIDARSH